MKQYEAPVLTVEEIKTADVIAATFTETGSDNNTDWLDSWASVLA